MNKTFRLLMIIVSMACCGVVMGQSLSSALKSYFELNGGIASFKNDQLREGLVEITKENVAVPSGDTPQSYVGRYMDEQLVDDYVSLLVPFMLDEGITTAQVEEINTFLQNPKAKTAVANATRMGSDEVLADMIAVIQRDMVTLLTDGTVNEVKKTASDERQRLFHGYYEQSGIEQLIPPLMKAQLGNQVSAEVMEKVNTYFERNMEPLLLMASDGVMSDEDLLVWTQLTEFPQYGKLINGATRAVSDPQQLGLNLIQKYMTWAEKTRGN